MKPSALEQGPDAKLQAALGYRFRKPDLLIRALTHASANTAGSRNNERLEFLGDRVLGLAVAAALMREDPQADEGTLARRLNSMVRRESCADRAAALGIDAALRLGDAEAGSGGRNRTAILANACEAVLGAVYLDGGYAAAERAVLAAWAPLLADAGNTRADPKTALQEHLQAGGEAPPTYRVADRRGPDHNPHFVVEVAGAAGILGTGEGGSKRAAEQAAAEAALARLGGAPPE